MPVDSEGIIGVMVSCPMLRCAVIVTLCLVLIERGASDVGMDGAELPVVTVVAVIAVLCVVAVRLSRTYRT